MPITKETHKELIDIGIEMIDNWQKLGRTMKMAWLEVKTEDLPRVLSEVYNELAPDPTMMRKLIAAQEKYKHNWRRNERHKRRLKFKRTGMIDPEEALEQQIKAEDVAAKSEREKRVAAIINNMTQDDKIRARKDAYETEQELNRAKALERQKRVSQGEIVEQESAPGTIDPAKLNERLF